MFSYTTRVELHGATREQYNKLHAEMKARGFVNTIKGNDGVTSCSRRPSTCSTAS